MKMSNEQVSDALKRKYNTFDEQLKAMAEVAKYVTECLIQKYGDECDVENFGVMLALLVAHWLYDTGVNLQDWLKVLDICYTLYKISDAI
jgi:cell division protein ZapA (FtsZ GTPase activity inhibitor)